MPETVTHAEFAGRSTDGYGAPIYGTPANFRARVLENPHLVTTREGAEVMARGVVWVATATTIGPEDQITLPDGTTPPIVAVDRVSDQDGTHHMKVHFR